eukprot:symbB.v1.2.025971.t1/scaffold2560.1/size76387/3
MLYFACWLQQGCKVTFASGKWHKMMFLNVDGALLRDAVKALVDQDTVEDRHSRRWPFEEENAVTKTFKLVTCV